MPNFIRKKTLCKECAYFERNDDDNPMVDNGLCLKSPPIPIMIPNVNNITGQMGASIQSVSPPVMGDNGCFSGRLRNEFSPITSING